MKRWFLLAFVCVAGCGPVMLVHPKTGERVTCGASSRHPFLDPIETSACARQHEALGFIRAENLTPEQRAAIISNPRPIEVQQDITIRQAPAKDR